MIAVRRLEEEDMVLLIEMRKHWMEVSRIPYVEEGMKRGWVLT